MIACLAWAGVLVALAGTEAPSSNARLAIRIAAPPSVVAAFTTRLNARLAARGVAVEVASIPEVDFERLVAMPADTADDAPLARVWLDGRDPTRALLFVLPRQGQRVLVRKVALTAGFDQVALAQTTYIIDRAVASLLSSEPIGVPQSEARAAVQAVLPPPAPVAPPPATPPPAAPPSAASPATPPPAVAPTVIESVAERRGEPEPEPDPEPSGRHRFSLAAFGGVGTWSGEAVAVGRVGIEGMVERPGDGHRLGLAASAVVDPGFHVVRPAGDLLTRAAVLHLHATGTWRIGGAGFAGVALGPAIVLTHVAPSFSGATPAAPALATPRTDLDLAVGATARWELPLGRRASVFLAAMVDVVPLRPRYAATVDGQDQVLFSPWRLRPGLVLGGTLATAPR